MSELREAAEVTMLHPVTGHRLVQKRSAMKYHNPDDPPGCYRGSIVSGTYFWCQWCGRAYMSTKQFGNEEFKDEARRYSFVLASSNTPLRIVSWIK